MDEIITTKGETSLDDKKWMGADLEAKANPITEDPGGDPRLIRQFWFDFNPEKIHNIQHKWEKPPTTQDLFNAHVKQIEVMLWTDGLEYDTDFQPRVVVGKKRYKIVIVAKPRRGVLLGTHNKIDNITELLRKSQ